MAALLDSILREKFRQIIYDWGIRAIVETGTDVGTSTVLLAEFGPFVFGIEVNPKSLSDTLDTVIKSGRTNIAICSGDSPKVLRNLMPLLPDETLFLLDAHTDSSTPLLEEIRTLRKNTGVMAIHDFLVPNDLGLTHWPCGVTLEFSYVERDLKEWCPDYVLEYNSKADAASPVGVAYIFPGKPPVKSKNTVIPAIAGGITERIVVTKKTITKKTTETYR